MEKFNSLKRTTDFGRVYHQGRSYGNEVLVLYYVDGGQDQVGRIGISVSKKIGNSVMRHKVKRRIKECFRTHLNGWKDGIDIVVVARHGILEKDFKSLIGALEGAGKHLNIYNE